MGGKKAPSAKEKAADKARAEAAQSAKKQEDLEWERAGEGKKSKAQAKRENKDAERQETAAKKAEAKRLAAEEDAAMINSAKKTPAKVTQAQLSRQREEDAKAAEVERQRRESAARREMGSGDYEAMVSVRHENDADGVDARNVSEAIAQLGVEDEQPRMKFSQYLERELPALKMDKPGLKQPQYKDIIWKKWLRSPENPLNFGKK